MIFALIADGETRTVEVTPASRHGGRGNGRDTLYTIRDGDETVNVDAREVPGGYWSILIGARSYHARVLRQRDVYSVEVDGRILRFQLTDPARAAREGRSRHAHGPGHVTAPMPGRVVKILVRPGQDVKHGQGVAVVEAMKMENELVAPRDGVVTEVRVQEGETVEGGTPLVLIGDPG